MEILELFKNLLLSQKGGISKITLKNYLSDVRHFINWFENTTGEKFSVEKLTPDTLSLYEKTMGAQIQDGQALEKTAMSSSSMKRHLSSLRKLTALLQKEGTIKSNPFSLIASEETPAPTDYWHLKAFKEYLLSQNASKITVKNYLSDIQGFARWYEEAILPNAEAPLTKNEGFYLLTSKVLEEYKKRLVEIQGSALRTVNRKLSSLRKYLDFASKKGFISLEEISLESMSLPKPESVKNERENLGLSLNDIKKAKEEKVRKYSIFPPLRLLQKLVIFPYLALEEGAALLIAKTILGKQFIGAIPLPSKLQEIIKAKNTVRHQQQTVQGILRVKNAEKEFFAPAQISTSGFPFHKKLIHHIRFTRPEWYKRYHSYTFVHYVHFALLIIFASGVGVALYQNFLGPKQLPSFAAPVAPPRTLSFQGRLTDNLDNPITSPTDVRFAIYNDSSASGAALLWQEVDYQVTPDQDGIFSVTLGDNTTIPASVFSDNASLFLGVTIGTTSELTPRQKIASVAYASNSEFLQGMLPITAAGAGTTNVVLALDSSGDLTIGGTANPTFTATGGQFTVSGQTTVIQTNSGSNGNVTLAPDGTGKVDVQKPLVNTTTNGLITPGGVEVDDKFGVLATESAVAAFMVNNNGASDIFTASSSGSTKFTIANDGTLTSSKYNTGGGILFANSLGDFSQTIAGSLGECLQSQGGLTPTWGTCGGGGAFHENLGSIVPNNLTEDLLIGGNATNSAKFGFVNVNSGNPTATISGNLGLVVPTGSNSQNLFNILNGGSLNFQTSGGGDTGLSSRLFLANDGRIGIGNSAPSANTALEVKGISSNGPAIYANSNSSFATFLVNNSGSGDLITASSSGTTNFLVANNGDLTVGPGGTGKITAGVVDPYLVQNQKTTGTTSLTLQTMGGTGADIIFKNQSTDLLHILQNGKVGIGVSNPQSALEVAGDITPDTTGRNLGSASTPFNTIYANNIVGSGSLGYWNESLGALSPSNVTDDLLLGANATSSALVKLGGTANSTTFFNTGGNVGIGTNNPQGTLEINAVNSSSPLIVSVSSTASSGKHVIIKQAGQSTIAFGSYSGSYTPALQIQSYDNSKLVWLGASGSTNGANIRTAGSGFDIRVGGTTATAGTAALSIDSSGNVGIGDTSPSSLFTVGSSSQFQVNSSGAIAAATGITSSGAITFSGFSGANDGGLIYANSSGILSQTGAGSSSQCLLGGTTPSFGSCSTGSIQSPFEELSGAIVPLNSTDDLLIGGQATTSAVFAVTGLSNANHQTTASASGNLIVMPNNGFGGNIGIGTTTPTANLDIHSNFATTGYPLNVTNPGYYQAHFQGTNPNNQVSYYLENDRGSFTSYGGFLYGGSTSTLSNLFGQSRADKLFMFADGASNQGMWVGTLSNAPFAIGTNDTERIRVLANGNVGIGNTSPSSLLSVGSSSQFQVNSSGAIAAATGITSSGSVTFSGFSTNGGLLYTNGSGVVDQTAAGTSGYILQSNGGGAPTWVPTSGLTAGSVAFNNITTGTNTTAAMVVGSGATLGTTGTGTITANALSSGTYGNALTLSSASNNITAGTLTATGGTINGTTIGATTPSTGAFTTLSANSTVTFSGLGTGIVKSTSGVLGLATAGTDYEVPLTFNNGLTRSSNTIGLGGTLNSNSSISFAGNTLTLGDNTGNGNLIISPNAGGQAALIINKQGSNDIFTASASGSTKFTIANDGTLTDAKYTTDGGLLYTNTSGVVSQTTAGTSGYILQSNGGGAPTWIPTSGLTAGSVAFNNITTGTNTTATMTVGTGGTLTYSGSGTINASTLAGSAITALPYVNNTTDTTLTRSGSGPYTLGLNLGNANTWTGIQSFNSGKLALNGATSGTITLNASTVAGANTLTLPAATDTLVGKATTDTFTNKTFDTAGTGNVFKVNGNQITGVTGTGNTLALSASPTFTGTLSTAGLSASSGITFSTFTTNGGLLYTNGSGVLAQTGAGSSTQCLLGGTTPTFGSCATGTSLSPFQELSGAIVPNNSTEDLLIGGQATTSAKFAVLNVSGSATPTASISAGLNGALYLTADGTIATTAKQQLTIGGANSGGLVLNSYGVTVFQNPGSHNTLTGALAGLNNAGSGNTANGTAALEFSGGSNNSAFGDSAMITGGGTANVAVGANALSNVGGNNNTGVGYQSLQQHTNGSNNTALGAGAGSGFSINGSNNVFLGYNAGSNETGSNTLYIANSSTNSPLVLGNFAQSSLGINVADAGLGNTALIVNQPNSSDIFTASSSGNTKFTIANNGNLTATGTLSGLTGLSSSGTVTFSGFTGANNGGIIFANSSGVLSQTAAGSASQCLTGGTTPSWGTCGGGGAFEELAGAIVPLNSTEDLLIGGQATTSAVFAITGLSNANHQTTASASGNLIVMPNNGYGGNIGIGTTTPLAPLDIFNSSTGGNNEKMVIRRQGAGDLGISFQQNSVTAFGILAKSGSGGGLAFVDNYYEGGTSTEVGRISTSGLGIGTSGQPTLGSLDVRGSFKNSGTIALGAFTGSTAYAGLLVNNQGSGELIAASSSGATKFYVANNGDTYVGPNGTGKVYASTVDPPYTIDGQGYATYVPSMVGVKEEYTGDVVLNYDPSVGAYAYKLDFNNFEYQSGEWVFNRIIDPDISKVTVLMTPNSSARTWYKKDGASRTITLFADRPVEISYRLTAPRFDSSQWKTYTGNAIGLTPPPATTTGSSNNDNNIPVDPYFASLTINKENGQWVLKDSNNNNVNEISAFSQAIAASIKAGIVNSQEIVANSISASTSNLGDATATTFAVATNSVTIGGQNIKDFILQTVQNAGFTNNSNGIVSPTAQIDNVKTNIISPLADDSSVAINVNKDNIEVKNTKTQKTVAQITDQGDATFAGTLTSQNATVSGNLASNTLQTNDATISGTLHAGNIVANSIDGLDSKISSIASNLINEKTSSSNPVSTDASSLTADMITTGNLNAQFGIFEQGLTSMGAITATQVTAMDSLSVGTSFILSDNSINTLGNDLAIQSLRQGNVTFMGGLVKIDTDGNMNVSGNLNLLGNIAAARGIFEDTVTTKALATNIISPLPGNDLAISLNNTATASSKLKVQNQNGQEVLSIDAKGNVVSSGAATFAKLNLNFVGQANAVSLTEATATGSAGFATLRAGQPELTIDNPNVTEKSLIYITPFGSSDNQVIYLLRQTPNDIQNGQSGSFTVGVDGIATKDTQFNWLIVN